MSSATTDITNVGFIGLGDQGAPIARAIAEAGFTLHAWSRRPASLSALDGVPFIEERSVADLGAACDLIGLCLSQDRDTLSVSTEGGLMASMRSGAVLVNHGTGLPQEQQRLADAALPYGVAVLDAPVSGGRTVAEAHQLTTMVGGSKEVVERATPVFMAFSKTVVHLGPIGAGQWGKLFNNGLMLMNQQSIASILDLAVSLKLPLQPLVQALRAGSASSVALQAYGPVIARNNVDHMRDLVVIDVDLFRDALKPLGDIAAPIVARARAGAEGLPELSALIGS
jgi:3-hydroxyisobutyrate dehydrogenase-like beta-hydroxyacid dehydrogenase